MNRREVPFQPQQEAVLHYGHGEFAVLKPGQFVRCAVTGARIPLEDLKYWSVELGEAYASPEASLERFRQMRARRGR